MSKVDEVVDLIMRKKTFVSKTIEDRVRNALRQTLATVANIYDAEVDDGQDEIRNDNSDGVELTTIETLNELQQSKKVALSKQARQMFAEDEFVLDQSDTIVADDINRKLKWGYTLLHFAAADGNEDECDRLIGLGACRKVRDNGGKMPFQKAESNGHETLAVKLRP